MGKASSKGRYISKVGHYDIYAKDSMRSIKGGTKKEVSATDYVLYHSKKLIASGMKTKDLAVNKANELMEYHMIGK